MAIDGLISVPSDFDPAETLGRLTTEVSRASMNVFATVDHAAGATAVGLSLRPATLLIFGNAKGGTPLMQAVQSIGLDLPLKVLVWQDQAQQTWLSYNEPTWIAQRYGLPADAQAFVNKLTAVLHGIVQRAARDHSVEQLEAELDSELEQTFPASDPLPWSHDVK
jgi:uncharacterized protein (DUF302 family)